MRRREYVLLFVYALTVFVLSTYHEPWRDEVRAFSIVEGSGTIVSLFHQLKNEGHPFLWYTILWLLDLVLPSPFALPVASYLIALGAAFLMVKSTTFSFLEKTLWLFGVLPLYEYSVQSRNYGLGMLLAFAICSLWKDKFRNLLVLSILLFLLSNSSLFGLILASAFTIACIVESVLPNNQEPRPSSARLAMSALITAVGFIAACYQMYPESGTVVSDVSRLTLGSILKASLLGIFSQARFATEAISLQLSIPPTYFLIPIYITLIRTPPSLLFIALVVVAVEVTNRLVYPVESLRHQGFLVIAIVSAVWISRATVPFSDGIWSRGIKYLQRTLLVLLLLLQIGSSFKRAGEDITQPMSAAPAVARYIQENEHLSDAIFIAEPDYYAETLPYYLQNRIYLPREQRFSRIVSFTDRNARSLRMSELVTTAETLSRKYSSPVVLLYGHRFRQPGTHSFSFHKIFEFTESERELFRSRFTLEKRFLQAATDESYALYRYVPVE